MEGAVALAASLVFNDWQLSARRAVGIRIPGSRDGIEVVVLLFAFGMSAEFLSSWFVGLRTFSCSTINVSGC